MTTETLRITEIFYSLQGEARTAGMPTVFVRLTGCPLRCQYCDTEYAFHSGKTYAISEILDVIKGFECQLVTVTGGEPLAQPLCRNLLIQLCDAGYSVSLETSGALPIDHVDCRVSVVMDIKTIGSNESDRNLWSNIKLLDNNDQIKFVICDEGDYQWSRSKIIEWDLKNKVSDVLFSPAWGQQDPKDLAEWILRDHLPVRMQLQQHKQIWGDEAGR